MCLKMRHDQDDQVSISPEVDHGWVVDTECRVHLHYTPLVTPATNQVVRIAYSFCWAHVNQEIPAAAGWTSGTTDITIPSSGADTNQKKIASLFSTTPSGGSAASILHVKLTRLSSSAGDSYTTPAPSGTTTANIVMWAAGVHQLVDKPGTVAELPS
jgi:hypothetical protein